MQPHAPWLNQLHRTILLPRRRGMEKGSAEPKDAERFFSGLMWHLIDFGKHVSFHMAKRPPEVSQFLSGKSEDTVRDTDIQKQHGENGYLVLSEFVGQNDLEMHERCAFYIDTLSRSMSEGLLASGPRNREGV